MKEAFLKPVGTTEFHKVYKVYMWSEMYEVRRSKGKIAVWYLLQNIASRSTL